MFTVTFTALGTAPAAGVAVSQLDPQLFVSVCTLNVALPPVVVIFRLCEVGAAIPTWKL